MFTSTPRNGNTSLGIAILFSIVAALVFSPGAARAACPGEGDCCQPNGSPGCEDKECCEFICNVDRFCCLFEWDDLCVQQANDACICGHPHFCGFDFAGDCCQPNDSPGCNHAPCCDAVCPIDPFCCDTEWDDFCTNLAFENCTVCSITGDLNGDGVVNVLDLLILLENWGQCDNTRDCPADLNDDGIVNVMDLLILLENWG